MTQRKGDAQRIVVLYHAATPLSTPCMRSVDGPTIVDVARIAIVIVILSL